jgi:hypothetical protein
LEGAGLALAAAFLPGVTMGGPFRVGCLLGGCCDTGGLADFVVGNAAAIALLLLGVTCCGGNFFCVAPTLSEVDPVGLAAMEAGTSPLELGCFFFRYGLIMTMVNYTHKCIHRFVDLAPIQFKFLRSIGATVHPLYDK